VPSERSGGEIAAALRARTALVTGGAGFVGSRLCGRLLAEGVRRIVVVDNLLSAEAWNLPFDRRLVFVERSITDDAALAALEDEFDYVFHLATFHGNQNSIFDPLRDHENNALTTLKLLEHLKRFRRPRKVVYSSAGCSLGEKVPGGPTVSKEDAPIALFFDSPYQISKILGELYGNYYFTAHGVPFVKARFQNVYGPGEILGAGSWRGTPATVWRNVVPTFVYRALKAMPLRVEGEGSSRDFIFVEDIVDGLLRCAVFGEPGQVYNLGTGVETSIEELARQIIRLAESSSVIEKIARRGWDASVRRYGSTEKALRALGFRARIALPEGLHLTVKWTREKLAAIDDAIGKHDAMLEAPGKP
jgi:nucleoside-diphosphate-sugar epimerase